MNIVNFLVLCCVCWNYGDRAYTMDPPWSETVVHFDVRVRDNKAVCVPSQKELALAENSTVRLDATSQQTIERVKCEYKNDSGSRPFPLNEEYDRKEENYRSWFRDNNITKHMYGTWTCTLKFNKNKVTEISPVEQDGDKFSYVICDIAVKNPVVHFDVRIRDNKAVCIPSQNELVLAENSTVTLGATLHQQNKSIERVKCHYINDSGPKQFEFGLNDEYRIEEKIDPWRMYNKITKHMYGTWTCKLKFNKNLESGEIKLIEYEPSDGNSFSYVVCNITVKDPDEPITTTAATTTATLTTEGSSSNNITDNKIWYIIGGVGIIVLLIIIGQTIALCYFRRKAQPRRRMDNMRPRSRFGFDRGDRARYSAPPCKKSKASTNRAQADTDSHIYEMVGVNALYNKSSDLNPEANTDKNIKDRPPLPLPHEIPKPVLAETLSHKQPSPMTSMPSTLSLNSTSSSSTLINKKGKQLPPPPEKGVKKAPARPPKQVDEDSIPGSLRRPAIATPATAPAAASAPAPTKALPKAPSTESPMSELKNIFRKRNVGKDTQSPAKAEKKEPPKVQAKPKNNPPKPIPTQKPPNLTKPIVQQNQIKLILPKIEAAMKAPKPMKTIEGTSPIKPVTPVKLVPNVKQKPVPQKPVAHPTQKSVPKPLLNRPLPTPKTSKELPPEPVYPEPPPSPPIYQAPDDDFTHEDDDEEWTYEQLGQYNIYNI